MSPLANKSFRILIVDDELPMCMGLAQALSPEGYDVAYTDSAEKAACLLQDACFDLLLTDLRMPGMDGLALLERVKQVCPETLVIMITGFASISSAVEAIKKGAYDYIPKPFQIDDVKLTIHRALENRSLRNEVTYLRDALASRDSQDSFIGQSPAMQKVFGLVRQVAPARSNVLITGETGTGKELVARAIHQSSERAGKPFVVINCGALPESLLESAMFGHARGAFTGAAQARQGYFEAADSGTLFLDEIGDICARMQSNILRVLESGEFHRVGETALRRVDVRVIAATNKDLEAEMESGRFREDLFYRLNVVRIHLPPLRERGDDIGLLARFFLTKFAAEMRKEVQPLSTPAKAALGRYGWPGNVRELQNAMERAVILASGGTIQEEHLPKSVSDGQELAQDRAAQETQTLEAVERRHILAVLKAAGNNKNTAAKILGINRRTLYRKLERFGL